MPSLRFFFFLFFLKVVGQPEAAGIPQPISRRICIMLFMWIDIATETCSEQQSAAIA